MKALLIKPETQTIEEVEFAGTLEDAYRLLDVEIIERVEIPGHDIWIDEEGLYSGSLQKYGSFALRGGIYADYDLLAGRGLVTGKADSEDGETWGDVTITAEEVRTMVTFLS